MSHEKQAFFHICADAKPAQASYVSLYMRSPFYGGPEEGGWWGHDQILVAYHQCSNDVEAASIQSAVQTLAEQLSKQAKDDFNRSCAQQCEWLEARGLDSDFLPEVDGEVSYWVATENRPGSHVREGDRSYS